MEIRSKESRSKGLPPANPPPPARSSSPDSAAFWGRWGVTVQKQRFALKQPLGQLLSPPAPFPSPLRFVITPHGCNALSPLPCAPPASPPDGSSAFAFQTRTSTPPGTQGVGLGRWGGSGGGEPWVRAPIPVGAAGGNTAHPPACTHRPLGKSGTPDLKLTIKALFLSYPCPSLSALKCSTGGCGGSRGGVCNPRNCCSHHSFAACPGSAFSAAVLPSLHNTSCLSSTPQKTP